MESRVKLVGHAVHPMLIVFPLGLLGMAAIFDLIQLGGANRELATASYWMIAAGVITGLLAAVFGFVDWLGVPRSSRARRVGLLHGGGNVIVVALFIVAWLLRSRVVDRVAAGAPLALEVLALLLALVTAWLGGELVERLGVGVDEGAHVNAPSSLSDQPARSGAERAEVSRAA